MVAWCREVLRTDQPVLMAPATRERPSPSRMLYRSLSASVLQHDILLFQVTPTRSLAYNRTVDTEERTPLYTRQRLRVSALWAAAFVGYYWFLASWAGTFREIYDEVGLEVSWMTTLTLPLFNPRHWCGWLIPTAGAVGVVLLIRQPSRAVRDKIISVGFALMLGIGILCVAIWFRPLIHMPSSG